MSVVTAAGETPASTSSTAMRQEEELRLLAFEEIGERRFGGWTMGQVDIRRVSPALLLKYAGKSALNPFANSGRASMALLEELIATGAVASRVS